MEVILRRLEQLEKNMTELAQQVDATLNKFKAAEKQKMRRHEALNQLIRAIAEVLSMPFIYDTIWQGLNFRK